MSMCLCMVPILLLIFRATIVVLENSTYFSNWYIIIPIHNHKIITTNTDSRFLFFKRWTSNLTLFVCKCNLYRINIHPINGDPDIPICYKTLTRFELHKKAVIFMVYYKYLKVYHSLTIRFSVNILGLSDSSILFLFTRKQYWM